LLRIELARWSEGQSSLATQIEQEVTLTGVIVREPDRRERSVHWYLKTDGGDTVLAYGSPFDQVAYGDLVTLSGTLAVPEAFTTEFGRTFDYPGYLLAREVEYVMFRPEVTVVASNQGNWLVAGLLSAKQSFTTALGTYLHEPSYGLAVGLLLGIKQALGDELEMIFRQAGIIHIVVLSGYNVMLVVAFVLFTLSFIPSRRVRMWCGLLAIWCFALLVGLSATVVRACIMASIFLVATTYDRTYLVTRALCIAGTVMLLFNPYLLLYDIGFQLSFMATLGLILIAPQFETLLMRAPARLGVKNFFIATVATQIAVLPLLMYHIGEISLVSVLVNVLVLPIVPVAMLLTFLLGLAALVFSPLALLLSAPTSWVLSYIVMIATWSTYVPYAAVSLPLLPVWTVFVLYGIGGMWWYRQYSSMKRDTKTKRGRAPTETRPRVGSDKTEPPIFFR